MRPQVAAFEARRGHILKDLYQWIALFILLWVIAQTDTRFIPKEWVGLFEWLLKPITLYVFLLILWATLRIFAYKNDVKEYTLAEVLRFLGHGWMYKPDGLYPNIVHDFLHIASEKKMVAGVMAATKRLANEFKNTVDGQNSSAIQPYVKFGIIPHYSVNGRTYDYVHGEYKQAPISFFKYVVWEGSARTKFYELVVCITMPKPFTGHTIITRDYGMLGNWVNSKLMLNKLKPVTLEDPQFEKQHEVSSTDPLDARDLLSPNFTERLLMLEESFKASDILFPNFTLQYAFKEGQLLLTIPTTKAWLSISSIKRTVDFIPEINRMLKDLDQLFAVIDILKLDDKSGF